MTSRRRFARSRQSRTTAWHLGTWSCGESGCLAQENLRRTWVFVYEALSDARLGTRAAPNAHAGVVCVCARVGRNTRDRAALPPPAMPAPRPIVPRRRGITPLGGGETPRRGSREA